MALMSSGYTSDIFTSSSPVLQPVKGTGGGSCAEMLWGSAGCSRHSPQTLRCAQREAQHPHPPQPLTFQRAQPAGEPPLELDVELGDPDGAGEIQGDPLARALEAEMVPRTGYGGDRGPCAPPVPPPPSILPRPRAPTWSEFQHVSSLASNMCFFPNCFTSRFSTELTLRGEGGGAAPCRGQRQPPRSPPPPRGPGLTAWRCQRRPTAPPASLRATDLDGNRDIAGARQHPEPPREAPEQR